MINPKRQMGNGSARKPRDTPKAPHIDWGIWVSALPFNARLRAKVMGGGWHVGRKN